ncbi:hypothetical protein [Parasitella parasitica]|uniref:Uncharacterized protein n=1 Tax=Parasitella parasitica TaxID=35722 RepID=A0A0B7NK06_9FUNG|nr:hypothetical protein [Parasitella parasitica]
MLKIPKNHSLCAEFNRKFRDILLVPDPVDKDNVTRFLSTTNTTWDYKVASNPSWVWRRVKRSIPPPDELMPLLKRLFEDYGPIVLGRVSDPEDIPLYTLYGYDNSGGLAKYHCCRGTNSLEGGVHSNIVKKFSSINGSVRLADAALADYRLRHNANVTPAPRRFSPQPFVVPLHQLRSSRIRRYRRCQTCSVFGCPGGQSRGTCQNKCTLCGIVWCSGRPSFPGGNCQNRL